MITIAIITLLIFLVLGVPVSFAIGLSGLLAIVMGSDVPSFMAVQQAIRGMNSFSLMAGPLFILAGEILGAAKLSKRILDFCRACISQLRGGLGMVSVMANMIFAGISGSGAATMSAVSTLTVPELKKAGYDRAFIASMIAGSGALAPIIAQYQHDCLCVTYRIFCGKAVYGRNHSRPFDWFCAYGYVLLVCQEI